MTSSIRHTQNKNIAVNAVTHAQTGVWVGAEAFRQYLLTLDQTALLNLDGRASMTMNFGMDFGDVTARNVTVTDMGSNILQVSADIFNIHTNAQSSASLGVVYQVTVASSTPPSNLTQLDAALNFYDDIETLGAITFNAPAGAPTEINVEGDFSANWVGLNGVSVIRATGVVDLGASVTIGTILSNSDVYLKNGSYTDRVATAGNVYAQNGSAGIIQANGDVDINTHTTVTQTQSRSNVTVRAGSHGTISAQTIFLDDGYTGDLESKGDITFDHGFHHTGNITSEGSLQCPDSTHYELGNISFNGTINCIVTGSTVGTTAENASNSVSLIPEIDPFVIPPFVVDVWKLQSSAHYIFEYKDGHEKVTVQNVNNVPDGEYFIGRYGNYRAQLCTAITGDDVCVTPAVRTYLPMCLGSSVETDPACISYDVASETWSITGNSTAPGALWFKGNLTLNIWYTYSTFLATGHIVDNGNFKARAINYGDKTAMCEMSGPDISAGHYHSSYDTFYPTDMCTPNGGDFDFTPSPVGNVVLASGGYDPDDPSIYTGGDISLGFSTETYGSVLAGGHLKTHGSSVIYGYVMASDLSEESELDNELNGGTTVDLTAATEHFDPSMIPNMAPSTGTGGSGGTGSGTTPGQATDSQILWSRPL